MLVRLVSKVQDIARSVRKLETRATDGPQSKIEGPPTVAGELPCHRKDQLQVLDNDLLDIETFTELVTAQYIESHLQDMDAEMYNDTFFF